MEFFMMRPVFRVDGDGSSATDGKVVPDVEKGLWNWLMISAAVVLGPLTFTWDAFAMFCILTYFTLLVGHSAGMHRMMIHKTYRCPKWLERLLVYIGVLVGMAGPFGILRVHDLRDWAQRHEDCHAFFAHRKPFLVDLFWQLTCRFSFANPPRFSVEPELRDDPWYIFMEKTWRWHQLLLAMPLYLMGGLSWVVWGICVRISVSVIGHWSITYFCHNPGPGTWRVRSAGVQASNIPGLGLLTYGECWHNNHHAFPESARIGLEKGQSDPAWLFIRLLQRLGLARDVGLPRPEPAREDIFRLVPVSSTPAMKKPARGEPGGF
jgi:fatty-acid desaturase